MPRRPTGQHLCRPPAAIGPQGTDTGLLARVGALAAEEARAAAAAAGAPEYAEQLLPGKLLRSRFAARVAAAGVAAVDRAELAAACVAVELAHTASLCHDDVIDNAFVRRSLPTLWRRSTPSAAVLLGDVLLCRATALLAACAGGRHLAPFLAKVSEVCTTEARHELVLRGRPLEVSDCLAVARGKTGPLFAFLGFVAGGAVPGLAAALEESGYRLGTAYQLADDLLDVEGKPETAGKTLGTDRSRGKWTLPLAEGCGADLTARHVRALLEAAVESAAPWPPAREAVRTYVDEDLVPAMERQGALTTRRPSPERRSG